MSGHRKFWASLWCHISTVSLVFKFSRAFLEIFRSVFTPTTSVMKFWSLFDAIFLWCTGSGSLGPVDPITGLLIFRMFWLDLAGDWVSPHGRIKEVVHQGPEDSHQPSAGAGGVQPLCQDVLIRLLALSSRSFFCYTTESHLFQTVSVSVWEWLTVVTLVSIFGTCVTFSFCFRNFFCIQYGGGRILFREQSSSSDGSSAKNEPLVKDTCSVQQGQSSWIGI